MATFLSLSWPVSQMVLRVTIIATGKLHLHIATAMASSHNNYRHGTGAFTDIAVVAASCYSDAWLSLRKRTAASICANA